ncbi:sugar transferase [Oscillatoria sp. FACHB-1407]|uniref:sugar transferase n=1 Tax=Oscillatoria sp. FACHB-1407 TaxID=2692847 RepID=UPI00168A2313|nr:sugar transferase [Oscillatoria sp. FACHB-1407]MBD2459694.1 sugar transferase [Oscillatoria sp. FACHB-1407]
MAFMSSPVNLNADLRSPSVTHFRKGFVIGWSRVAILLLADILSIVVAWYLAVTVGTRIESAWTIDAKLLPLILAIKISILTARGLYKAGNSRRDYFGLIKAISLSEGLLLLIAFLLEPKAYISRSTFLLSWFLSLLLISIGRWVVDAGLEAIRKRGAVRYPVFLISEVEHQEKNLKLIEQENRYNVIGVADSSCLDKKNREKTFESLRKMGIAEAFVSWRAIQKRLHVCWYFQTAGITLRILPTDTNSFFPKSESWTIGGIPSLTVPVPVIVGGDYWMKRCFDFCCSSLAILILSPIYLLIALFIRLDSPGPIFFRQTRIGLYGREFKVWKFRTMVQNASQLQAKLEAQNEMKDGVLFKMKDDPRITKVGRFLRAYSLDELPQLFNVLVGQMSIVGPRPLPVRDVEKFEEKHFIRQEVLPGITGLWQVSGRSDITNFDDVLNLDNYYISNWSIWLDLRIILQTVRVVLQKTGAY